MGDMYDGTFRKTTKEKLGVLEYKSFQIYIMF